MSKQALYRSGDFFGISIDESEFDYEGGTFQYVRIFPDVQYSRLGNKPAWHKCTNEDYLDLFRLFNEHVKKQFASYGKKIQVYSLTDSLGLKTYFLKNSKETYLAVYSDDESIQLGFGIIKHNDTFFIRQLIKPIDDHNELLVKLSKLI